MNESVSHRVNEWISPESNQVYLTWQFCKCGRKTTHRSLGAAPLTVTSETVSWSQPNKMAWSEMILASGQEMCRGSYWDSTKSLPKKCCSHQLQDSPSLANYRRTSSHEEVTSGIKERHWNTVMFPLLLCALLGLSTNPVYSYSQEVASTYWLVSRSQEKKLENKQYPYSIWADFMW